MTCPKAAPRPHFHATGPNAAQPMSWRMVVQSSSSRTNILRYLRAPRAVSSVGSEHLVYTEGVGGSSPSPPTQNKAQKPLHRRGFLLPKHAPSLLVGGKGQQKVNSPEGRAFVLCSGNAPPLGPPTKACEGGSPPVVQARIRLVCGQERSVKPCAAIPQCFPEHHEGRHPPQTNCHPPKSRLHSRHSPGHHPVLPMENP